MSEPNQSHDQSKVLIAGSARTGKSEQIVSRIKEYSESGINFLLVVPKSDSVIQYKRLISDKCGGLFNSSILSLKDLIKKIEQQSGQPQYESAKSYELYQIVFDIIRLKMSSGKLEYFKEAAELQRFPDELLKLFSEFIQSTISPNDLMEINAGWKQEQKLSEIRSIYEQYLSECRKREIGSEDLLLSNVVEYLSAENNVLSDHQALIVDGFYDYTPLQKKLFQSLFEKFDDVLLTHLYDENRKSVFKFAERAVELFEGFKSISPKYSKWGESPIAMIRENIFDDEEHISDSAENIPISVIEEPGLRKLAEALARKIKRLIVDENIIPSDIGIIYRQGNVFPKLIDQTFAGFGIPVTINNVLPIAEYQSVYYLKKLLSINPERNIGIELRGLLTSNYTKQLSDVEKIDNHLLINVMREAGATDDRRSCIRRLNAFLQKSKADYYLTDDDKENIETAIAVITELIEVFTPPNGLNKYDNYVNYVKGIADFMGIGRELSREADTSELMNRIAFEKSMNLLDVFSEYLPERKTNYSEFRNLFFMALDDEKLNEIENSRGRVEVMKVMDARWRSFHTVFICDLSEGTFPVKGHSTGLLNNRIRNLLDSKNPSSLSKDAEIIHDEERLLYYITLARADEQLFLCYSNIDATGRDLLRSNFVDATEAVYRKITGRDAIPLQSGTVKKMFDSDYSPASEDELMRAVALSDIKAKDILISAGIKNESLIQLDSMTAVRNQQLEKVPSYSGVINDQTALKFLSEIYDEKKDWSATEIERYGKCPFLYLIEKVWKIKIDDEFVEEIAPLEKGSFYHDVLKFYYSAIIDGKSDNSLEGNTKLMLSAIERVTKYDKYKMRGIAPILWQLSITEAKEVLTQLVEEDQKKKNDGLFPIAVETAFGMQARKNESPYSVEAPFILDYDDFSIRLKGRIDRIDANEDLSEYSVIDYKSGSVVPKKESISDGISLQLPLYIEAVKKTILNLKKSEPHSGYYYGLKKLTKTFAFNKADSDQWDDVFEVTKDFIGEYIGNIRSGIFHVEPKDCKFPCEWSDLCRFGEISKD